LIENKIYIELFHALVPFGLGIYDLLNSKGLTL
jgi:hypothetical protein